MQRVGQFRVISTAFTRSQRTCLRPWLANLNRPLNPPRINAPILRSFSTNTNYTRVKQNGGGGGRRIFRLLFRCFVFGAVIVLVPLVMVLRNISARAEGDIVATPEQLAILQKLPLRALSRFWGWANSIELPVALRSYVYKGYSAMYNANLEEVEKPLSEYKSLQEFFTRRLKPGSRPIADTELVSPADGVVARFGQLDPTKDHHIEQVKGVSYPLSELLRDAAPVPSNGKSLYYCVVYLAPGDYHCFHSPTEWTVDKRVHVTGQLFPVHPVIVKCLPVFAVNERVVLGGAWKHGAFTYTAVGATNVGSIDIDFDSDLQTNQKIPYEERVFAQRQAAVEGRDKNVWGPSFVKTFGSTDSNSGAIALQRGDSLGKFKLGSTIVLVFECNDDAKFEFTVEKGQKIVVGQPLGRTTNKTPASK